MYISSFGSIEMSLTTLSVVLLPVAWKPSGSVITSWGIMVFLGVASWLSTRKLRERPGNYQVVLEGIVLAMQEAIESVLPGRADLLFSFVATLWIFIFVAN